MKINQLLSFRNHNALMTNKKSCFLFRKLLINSLKQLCYSEVVKKIGRLKSFMIKLMDKVLHFNLWRFKMDHVWLPSPMLRCQAHGLPRIIIPKRQRFSTWQQRLYSRACKKISQFGATHSTALILVILNSVHLHLMRLLCKRTKENLFLMVEHST